MGIFHFAVLLALWTVVAGYPKGPPASACESMIPTGHGTGISGQVSKGPYTVYASTHDYAGGQPIKVGLYGEEKIEGFFIQARNASNTAIRIGSWVTNVTDTKLMTCTNAADSVSQSKEIDLHNIDLTWNPPANESGKVTFLTTLVRHKDTYWVQKPSVLGTAKRWTPPQNAASISTITLTTVFAVVVGSLLMY